MNTRILPGAALCHHHDPQFQASLWKPAEQSIAKKRITNIVRFEKKEMLQKSANIDKSYLYMHAGSIGIIDAKSIFKVDDSFNFSAFEILICRRKHRWYKSIRAIKSDFRYGKKTI